MDAIYVTVRTRRQAMDLKIPDYITGAELLNILSEITGEKLPAGTIIQAEPIGRILDHTQTLASDGVETGALLTLT